LLQRLHIGGDIVRPDRRQRQRATLAPGKEPAARPRIGAPRVWVADVGGEEFHIAPAGGIKPPHYIGRRALSGNKKLDFLIRHPSAGYLGVECKNVRVWLYPHDSELKEALQKCLALDAVPVLIARRVPYVTFVVLSRCGVIMHQLYNQLLPNAAADIAAQAKQKTLLG
jgi:hypothetical protein